MKKLNLLFTAILLLCCVGTAKAVEVTIDGIKYDVIAKGKQATIIDCDSDISGDFIIPSEITYNNVTCSVTSIGKDAFYNCYRLTSITIPNSVTSIESYAFWNCSGLTSITIPNSVTSIGENAFSYCEGLTSATIGNSVTSIGSSAFEGCYGLTSITIGSSVTSIGDMAFYSCSGLKEVHINDLAAWCNIDFESSSANPLYYAHNLYLNNELVTELVIPNGVTSIGYRAFQDCDGLTSITIPNSVTSIGNNAFRDCSGLTSVTIGNSVTSIGEYAFCWCTSLTSVTIGNSVTSIGWNAFSYCENLADVYCLATDVPTTKSDAFSGSYPEYMTLHVPAASINNYKTTAPWSTFGNIVTLDGDIVETPKCENPVIKYNNGEIEIECETTDAEFVTKITSSDFNSFYSNSIALTATYNISVYATATGHDNSDTVNATLCWIECDCNENNNNNIINIPAKEVLVTSNNGTININCALEGEVIELYTIDAMHIGSTTIENGCATIESGLSKGDIAIIKIAEKSIKVILN